MTPVLDVRDVHKRYRISDGGGERWLHAVRGVSFSVDRGRTLGIVGESGCGKTTTARLVLGLVPASSGRVALEGDPVTARQDSAWRAMRRRMQMVYQNPMAALDRRLRVGDQVAEPLLIQGITRDGAKLQAKAADIFDAVGLRADMLGRYPHELSGGQRQRVVLARALILQPSLLVCDEPVSALDVSVAAQVINLLQDLQGRFGTTYLFISHDLKIVRQIADEVAVMFLGRIVEQGPPDALFHAPAHPYTEALVSAVSSLRNKSAAGRIVLKGDLPSPVEVPSGCAFHSRCPRAFARCTTEAPELGTAADGRSVACHLIPRSVPFRTAA